MRLAARCILVLLPTLLLAVLLWLDVAPAGHATFQSDLSGDTANISAPYPRGRVSDTRQGQAVQAEPLYVDVRLPRRLDTLSVELSLRGETDGLVFGLRQPPLPGADWRYDLRSPEFTREPDGSSTARTSFSLVDAWVEDRRVRLLIGLENVERAGVVIEQLTVTVSGRPVTLREVAGAVARRLRHFL